MLARACAATIQTSMRLQRNLNDSNVMQRNETLWLAYSVPVIFVVIWSTGFVVARYGMPFSPPLTFLGVRFALSAVGFGLWAWVSRAVWPKSLAQLGHIVMTGVLMQAVYLSGVWSAVKAGMGAGLCALMVSLQPVLTAFWVSIHGGQVSLRQWTGLMLGVAGLTLVVWAKLGGGEIHITSLFWVFAALLGITAGTLYQKRFVESCSVCVANFIQLTSAMLVIAPLALLEQGRMQWVDAQQHFELSLIGAMAWSVLGLTLGGSSLLYLLIQRGAATSVASLFYLVPPTTALMAWFLFGEPITGLVVAGTLISAVGVSLVVRKRG